MNEKLKQNKYLVFHALYNYGYRTVGKEHGAYIFGKPVGYGILKAVAKFLSSRVEIKLMLIVKGIKQDNGKKPNLVWQSVKSEFTEEELDVDIDDAYAIIKQSIADSEAKILKSPLDFYGNRQVPYDFVSNDWVIFDMLYGE